MSLTLESSQVISSHVYDSRPRFSKERTTFTAGDWQTDSNESCSLGLSCIAARERLALLLEGLL